MKKHTLFILLATLLLVLSCSGKQEAGNFSTVKQEHVISNPFDIRKGINIAHWLSQSNRRGQERDQYLQEHEIKNLATLGFDHIRLPVDEAQLLTAEGELDTETVQLLHRAIGWCKKYHLRVIVDLHILHSHDFGNAIRPLWTSKEARDQFENLWLQLNSELRQYPNDLVAYELLNEPVAPDNEVWNELANRVIRVIRAAAPQRVLFIGANQYNNIDHLKQLDIPAGDPNIVLSFHWYEPYPLTHYRASWTPFAHLHIPVIYPGVPVTSADYARLEETDQWKLKPYQHIYSKETIKSQIQAAFHLARKRGLSLHCGEFGCLPAADAASRYRWYQDLVSIFTAFNIPYTAWEYKEIFGFSDRSGAIKDSTLLNILVQK